MKILAIRGRNIASLEGTFEIDFTAEPLASAGIFAISGPTGAGKSTLLDAMCLALFNRTPRTESATEKNVKLRDVSAELLGQNDPRFLLRRGSASGYAEVDFVALNGFRYRARWSVSRAREKAGGRLQAPTLTLYNIDKASEEPGTRTELQNRVVELIGLTFDQFTRSVLLAQNDFSAFLKAEQGEKASLLEKLTGTELYSLISKTIYVKSSEARAAYEKVCTRIQGIELLTDEEEQAMQQQMQELEARCVALEKDKTERQRLEEAVRTVEEQQQQKAKQRKEAADRLEQASKRLAEAMKEYEKGRAELQQSEADYKKLQADLVQVRKLDMQIETENRQLQESETKHKAALRKKNEHETQWKQALLRQKQGEEEVASLQEWRAKRQAKAPIAEQISVVLLHLNTALTLRTRQEKSAVALSSLQKERALLEQAISKLAKQQEEQQAVAKQRDADLQRLVAQMEAVNVAAIEQQKVVLQEQRERLLVEQAQGDIRALRGRLEEGKPCPVCGSLHHPLLAEGHPVLTDDMYRAKIASMTLQLKELQQQLTHYQTWQQQTALLRQQQLAHLQTVADLEHQCTEKRGQQKLLLSQIAHEEAQQQEHSAQLATAMQECDQLFGSEQWQVGWKQNPLQFRQQLVDFAEQWKSSGDRLQRLQQQQSGWKAECDSLASFLPGLQQECEQALQHYERQQQVCQCLTKERKQWFGGRPADAVEQESARQMENLKQRLNHLQQLQNEQAGIAEQQKGVVDQIGKDQTELQALWVQRKQELAAWLTAWMQRSEGKELEMWLQSVTQQRSEVAFRLRKQAENRKKIALMQEELTRSRELNERWAKLNELAGSADGAKFRRIAQGYTLDLLLNYTNVQLRMLTHRYRLERVPDTLALQVIDRDMCDEVRTVHSLSGGESFLVSLALALGLSSLSSNRMKVESLFIDEGFGSLDADTLRVAMDALENLRTQGRKIGVISHVQEMTERISTQIRVSRSGNGRSTVEIVGV